MRHCILFWCVLLSTFSLFSQRKNIKIDSAFQVLKNVPNSIKKADNLIDLYKQSIRQKEINKSIIENALNVSESIFYIKGIGICYDRKGLTARYEQDYSNSIIYHKRALSFLEQTKDTFFKIKCLNSLGVTYRKLNLENEAFENYFNPAKASKNSFLRLALTSISFPLDITTVPPFPFRYLKTKFLLIKWDLWTRIKSKSLSNSW